MLFLFFLPAMAAIPSSAQSALLRGDCAEFSVQIGETSSPTSLLARARCGDTSGLDQIEPSDTPLGRWARLAQASSLPETQAEQIVALLQGLDFPGSAGDQAKLLRGKALIALGRSLEARPTLRSLLEGAHGAEARYWLSRGAEDRGDLTAAQRTYESLWTRFPTSTWSQKAHERLTVLGASLPGVDTPHQRALTLERARRLVKKNRAEESLPLFDMLLNAQVLEGDTALEEFAKARFWARDYAGAIEIWEQLSPMTSSRISVDGFFHYALAISRTGDYAQAAVAYKRLYERHPTTRRGDLSSFKIGYLDVDAGNHAEAIPKLQAHLQRRPSSRHADEARWFIGWSHFRLGQLEKAKTALKALVNQHPRSGLAIGGRYWLARIEGLQGRPDAEKQQLEELLGRHPHSGYAYFASERLGKTGEAAAPPTPLSIDLDPSNPLYEAALLVQAGWIAWARDELSTHRDAMKRATPEKRLQYAQLLMMAGDYRRAKRFLSIACQVDSALIDTEIREICLPRPESTVVTPTAAQSGLAPLLPYAIMTAESALDPSVTSPAGARGLMQLMPFLGEELHGILLPETPYDGEQLYLPGYNAWFGTTELGRLHTRFKGVMPTSLPLAIAGYNGGVEAVERWLLVQKKLPAHLQGADAFTENIGYTETRRYVRKVLGYLMLYRSVYRND